MSHQTSFKTATKNFYDFGVNMRRKTILEFILVGFSIILSVAASILLYFILRDPYIWEEWISDVTFLPIVPIVFGIFGLVMAGISIATLVFTILMLVAISRLRETNNHPELQRASLLLLIGFIVSMIGMSLIGLILQLLGWDALKKYFSFSQSGTETLQRDIKNYIISSIVITAISSILGIIIVAQIMPLYVDLILGDLLYSEFILEEILDRLSISNFWTIGLSILTILSVIPLIFSLRIANGIRSNFDLAKVTTFEATQSFNPQPYSHQSEDSEDETSLNIKYCQKCGKQYPIQAKFCATCGERI